MGDILKISNKRDLKSILESEGFSFKKSLGQNFLIDDTELTKLNMTESMGEHTYNRDIYLEFSNIGETTVNKPLEIQ